MRVLMIIRSTAFIAPGGDTIQAQATARHLRSLGVQADLHTTGETVHYENYDLIHFFNIIRPADILPHVHSGLPFVITPVFVNYHEYDAKVRGGLAGMLAKIVSMDRMEYIKAAARHFRNKEKIRSRRYWRSGHRRSVQELIKGSSMLLPNSENEAKRLFDHYKMKQAYEVIPNGIEKEIFTPSGQKNREGVLCVGQIQGLKNQLSLIRALKDTGLKLTVIGRLTINSASYFEKCQREAGGNVIFIDHIPQIELAGHYGKAKVHVLPSWFETTGLSSLEAAAMGCNIVITAKGDTREYFGKDAFYCDPGQLKDIREKVLNAYEKPVGTSLSRRIRMNYTWEIAAGRTLDAYKKTLS